MTIFGISSTQILAAIGALTLIFAFIKLLFELIPLFGSLKSYIYDMLAKKVKHKRLEKKAIASKIEQVVNDSVSHLQREMPRGWISKVQIAWVKEENQNELAEDELILRIRPLPDQDRNLINGIYYFFSRAVFPGIKTVIPKEPMKATALYLSRRTLRKRHPYLVDNFEQQYLEKAIQQDARIAEYLGHYQSMDQIGFFTGIYLREASDLAMKVRFSAERSEIADEIDEIIDQLIPFTNITPRQHLPDSQWYRMSASSSYALMLVAIPRIGRRVDTYVRRVQDLLKSGIKTVYLLGANQEKSFVRKVITAIEKQTGYAMSEIFELDRDYRGEPGGICAVYKIPVDYEIIADILSEESQD